MEMQKGLKEGEGIRFEVERGVYFKGGQLFAEIILYVEDITYSLICIYHKLIFLRLRFKV